MTSDSKPLRFSKYDPSSHGPVPVWAPCEGSGEMTWPEKSFSQKGGWVYRCKTDGCRGRLINTMVIDLGDPWPKDKFLNPDGGTQ